MAGLGRRPGPAAEAGTRFEDDASDTGVVQSARRRDAGRAAADDGNLNFSNCHSQLSTAAATHCDPFPPHECGGFEVPIAIAVRSYCNFKSETTLVKS